jgi:P-type Cu+ transporter
MTAAPEITQVELVVGGMTCAACAARVQAKLQKVPGVSASVNLSTERAYLTAPAHISAPDLIGVVEAAGYTAKVAAPAGPADDGAAAEEAAVRRLRRRLTLALVFFVPLTDASLMLSVWTAAAAGPAAWRTCCTARAAACTWRWPPR